MIEVILGLILTGLICWLAYMLGRLARMREKQRRENIINVVAENIDRGGSAGKAVHNVVKRHAP